MFDTRPALADMASQIRASRAAEGLTLQQLASRSGVAASTIHKVESQQMVPTVSVLLKIAKGLGTRPEALIRDQIWDAEDGGAAPGATGPRDASMRRAGVWRIALERDQVLPVVVLGPTQRAMVLVENGAVRLQAGGDQVEMRSGDCVEIGAGERIQSAAGQSGPARVTVIVSPPDDIEQILGAPQAPGRQAG